MAVTGSRPASRDGWASGFFGVLIFSGSLPATRVAVAGFDPLFLTVARACIAGAIAMVLIFLAMQGPARKGNGRVDVASPVVPGAGRAMALPGGREWGQLVVVALGVVVGFPLLTALALEHITAARSMVFIGLLPLSTAIFGVLRGGERPRVIFWLFSGLGSLLVAGFATTGDHGVTLRGDGLMLAAIVVCGLGYAEGASLSRRLGGWQVICWALVLAFVPMLAICMAIWPGNFATVPGKAWLGLGYVSVFSMLIGFFFWYRGLARGGIAAVGQLQLLQPFMGLVLAAALLGEAVNAAMIVVAAGVVACVAGAKRFG